MRIRIAITTRNMKFDNVSNPSQLANDCNGSGNMATIMNAIGNKNQAIEFLIDKLLFVRPMIMMINRAMAATIISICNGVIF